MSRIPESELDAYLRGCGWDPYFVSGDQPSQVHQDLAGALDAGLDAIAAIQAEARTSGRPPRRPAWPMIVLRTPKGWTGPKMVDGHRAEGSWRSHQVPLAEPENQPCPSAPAGGVAAQLPAQELFDETGRLQPQLAALAPSGERRMSANPHANGGVLLRDLHLPDFGQYAVEVSGPGVATGGGHPGARPFPPRRDGRQRKTRPTSGCSGPTRPPPTVSTPCSR